MPELLIRRNTVLEALRASRRSLHRLWLQEDIDRRQLRPILDAARARRLPIEPASKARLSQLAGDSRHQGIVLEAGPFAYGEVGDMVALARQRQEQPLLLLLDLLHGPQNIGSLLRTAEIVGVHGVIAQARRAPEITPAIVQFSAGAAEHLLVARVTNLVQTMRQLQEQDIWVVGLDLEAEAYRPGEIDLDRALAVVVGHEGSGLRRLVRERCDFLLQLPMRGGLDSLNAAVAGSVMLYLAWQARGFAGAR